jgi:hypothetical protein
MTLEPEKFEEFSSDYRLTFDEYCDAIDKAASEEFDDWSELRLRDQIAMSQDALITKTMIKYAKTEENLDLSKFNGNNLEYIKRYDTEGTFIGEAIRLTLLSIDQNNIQVTK